MLIFLSIGFAYSEEKLNQEPTPQNLPSYLASPDTDDEIDKTLESASIFWSQSSLEWMDQTRLRWSSNVVSIGAYIDSLMGEVDRAQDKNKSYLKVDFSLYDSKYGSTEFEPRIRFRLDLPILEEKLRLVFESEPDQAKDIDERKLSSFPSSALTETRDDIYASFQYLFDSKKWSRLSWDTGIKVRFRPDLFSRARAVRSWSLSEEWVFRYSQEIFWFESRGLGTQTQFDFDRRLNEVLLFRKTIALDWSERESRIDLLNQFSLFHTLSQKRAMQYAIGVRSDRQKYTVLVNNYYAKAVFRSSLHKNWLFYQIETGIEYPRDEAFRSNPFVGLKLEILFADDAVRELSARLH